MAIRVAFPLLGRGGWTGGFVYLKNTLKLIASQLADEVEASVFLSPEENETLGVELGALVDGRVIVDPTIGVSGRGASLVRAVASGRDAALEKKLTAHKIDVAFENAGFYGARFAVPVVSWMPDFQHRHMPDMFTLMSRLRRDFGFQAQIRAGRTIMVSSETARDDLMRFYRVAPERVHVVRFAIKLDITACANRGAEMRAIYDLPERYFFLPNQFWRHKNHVVIVDALERLHTEGALADCPPVVLTGLPKDPRNPDHFDALMARANAAGVADHFRYLGLVPYDHVLALNAGCERMINPSRFEGWSTPIEEAKALASPLLLSDISIHREQAPDAVFFDWRSSEAAAHALTKCAMLRPAARAPVPHRRAAQDARLAAHAASLLDTFRAAAGLGV